MQKDIKKLRWRIVLIVVLIVAIILGVIFGTIYKIIEYGLQRMAIDANSTMAIMRILRFRGWGVFLISLVVFALIGFLVSKWMVKPIENTFKEQKQFVSDASHELKTPMTVIMTNAELLQAENLSESDRFRFVNNILLVSRQMRSLIEDLLNLARVEKGEEAGFSVFDLSDSYFKVLLQFEPVVFESGLSLKDSISPDVKVYGSEQRLCQLLSILLDNACKYSKPGNIYVSLISQGKNAQIVVENPSDPISDDQLVNIFKRFYRVDEAHSSRESFGLGLSIAKSICDAHNGKIFAEYKNGFISFIANIPLA